MDDLNKEAYSDAGVTSSSGFSDQLGSPSSEVMLTDGVSSNKKKKLKKFDFKDAEGLVTTINGKKLKLTGLTDKEKDEYLFGSAKLKENLTKLEKSLDRLTELRDSNNSHES